MGIISALSVSIVFRTYTVQHELSLASELVDDDTRQPLVPCLYYRTLSSLPWRAHANARRLNGVDWRESRDVEA